MTMSEVQEHINDKNWHTMHITNDEHTPVSEWPTLDQFVARMAESENLYRNQKRTELYLNKGVKTKCDFWE